MIVISYVDISCTGGQPGVTNGGTLGVTAGNIIMNTGSGNVDITAANTYLRNTVHIDVPGYNGSSLFLYGSKTIESGIPAVELHASNGQREMPEIWMCMRVEQYFTVMCT